MQRYFVINSKTKVKPAVVGSPQEYHNWDGDSLVIAQMEYQKAPVVMSGYGSEDPAIIGESVEVVFQSNYRDSTRYGKIVGVVTPDGKVHGKVPKTSQTCYRMK